MIRATLDVRHKVELSSSEDADLGNLTDRDDEVRQPIKQLIA